MELTHATSMTGWALNYAAEISWLNPTSHLRRDSDKARSQNEFLEILKERSFRPVDPRALQLFDLVATPVLITARYVTASAITILCGPIGTFYHTLNIIPHITCLAIGILFYGQKHPLTTFYYERTWEHIQATVHDLIATANGAVTLLTFGVVNLVALHFAFDPITAQAQFQCEEQAIATLLRLHLKHIYRIDFAALSTHEMKPLLIDAGKRLQKFQQVTALNEKLQELSQFTTGLIDEEEELTHFDASISVEILRKIASRLKSNNYTTVEKDLLKLNLIQWFSKLKEGAPEYEQLCTLIFLRLKKNNAAIDPKITALIDQIEKQWISVQGLQLLTESTVPALKSNALWYYLFAPLALVF